MTAPAPAALAEQLAEQLASGVRGDADPEVAALVETAVGLRNLGRGYPFLVSPSTTRDRVIAAPMPRHRRPSAVTASLAVVVLAVAAIGLPNAPLGHLGPVSQWLGLSQNAAESGSAGTDQRSGTTTHGAPGGVSPGSGRPSGMPGTSTPVGVPGGTPRTDATIGPPDPAIGPARSGPSLPPAPGAGDSLRPGTDPTASPVVPRPSPSVGSTDRPTLPAAVPTAPPAQPPSARPIPAPTPAPDGTAPPSGPSAPAPVPPVGPTGPPEETAPTPTARPSAPTAEPSPSIGPRSVPTEPPTPSPPPAPSAAPTQSPESSAIPRL